MENPGDGFWSHSAHMSLDGNVCESVCICVCVCTVFVCVCVCVCALCACVNVCDECACVSVYVRGVCRVGDVYVCGGRGTTADRRM